MAQNALRTTTRYKDFNTGFNVHPVNGDIANITDDVCIKTSLRNILLTGFGERPFNPEFGSGIRELLFEPLDSYLEDRVKIKIVESISNYEPRVELIEVIVTADHDRNALNVNIIFAIINNPEPITLDIILYRVR